MTVHVEYNKIRNNGIPQILKFTVRKVTANNVSNMMPWEIILKAPSILKHETTKLLLVTLSEIFLISIKPEEYEETELKLLMFNQTFQNVKFKLILTKEHVLIWLHFMFILALSSQSKKGKNNETKLRTQLTW